MKIIHTLQFLTLGIFLSHCTGASKVDGDTSQLASLTIGEFKPAPQSAQQSDWVRVSVSIDPSKAGATQRVLRSFDKAPGLPLRDNSVTVPYGTYKIKLIYTDSKGVSLYESCTADQAIEHQIMVPVYKTDIKICRFASNDNAGSVSTGESSIEINPILTGDTNSPNMPAPAPMPASGNYVDQHGWLTAQGARLLDKNKQPIQLRGMSMFWSHWSADFWNPQLVHSFATDWKSTVIRAAMGVEEGGYLTNPQLEKDRVKMMVNKAVQEGIYVIIDWHDHHAHQHPDKAIEFFSEMASLYGQTPNVIFEVFNEPIDPSWDQVKAYAESVIGAIRSKGAKNLVIVGSPTWSQRVDSAADNPVRDSNVAYTLHFYAGSHRQELRDKAIYAINKGLTLFVTEWGVCDASGNGNIDLAETDRWMDFMNQYKISWANWSVNDKAESASAFNPGASRQGPWGPEQLTQSGSYVRRKILEGPR